MSAGPEAQHLTPRGERFFCKNAAGSQCGQDPGLRPWLPGTKKAYTKTCAEPACNNKATVTDQLSNAVLQKEHTALPCYA